MCSSNFLIRKVALINNISGHSLCAHTLIANITLKPLPVRTSHYQKRYSALEFFLRKLNAWVHTVSQLMKICLKCLKRTNLHVQMSLLGKQTGTTIHSGGCLKTYLYKHKSSNQEAETKNILMAYESLAISPVICNFIIKSKFLTSDKD